MANFQPKISVLMPFYNDRGYLKEAILSVLAQNYPFWELILADDGSKEDYSSFVNSFGDSRLKYLKLPHRGQLLTLLSASNEIKGDLVTMLHSDDRLDPRAFSKIVSVFDKENPDGVFSDLITINEKGDFTGYLKTSDRLDELSGIELFLRLGSNMISDVFFVKRDIFENWVKKNYLTNNVVYWWDYKEFRPALKLKKVSPYYFYRRYSQNYIKSEIGVFVAVMGSLRSSLLLAQKIQIPFFLFQRYFWLGPLKVFPFLMNFRRWLFRPIFRKKPSSFLFQLKLVRIAWNRFFGSSWPSNLYFSSLKEYLKNAPAKKEKFFIDLSDVSEVYTGKDEVCFYEALKANTLERPYRTILEAIKNGATIFETSKEKQEVLKAIFQFLNLPFPFND